MLNASDAPKRVIATQRVRGVESVAEVPHPREKGTAQEPI